MTEEVPRYRVERSPIALPSCARPDRFPKKLDLTVPAPKISAQRRELATRALELCWLEVVSGLRKESLAYETPDGHRVVRLWDLIEFSVDREGLDFRIEHLSTDPDIGHCLVNLSLSQPIGYFSFPAAFEPVLVAACRAVHLDPGCLPGPPGDFIRTVLRRTFSKAVHWNRLRRSVVACLRPHPLVYSLTKRVFRGGSPRLDSFDWVARHLEELALVAIEQPRLLAFLQITRRFEHGSPLEHFDRLMHEAGMTASARRKLEKWGFGAFCQAIFCFDEDSDKTIAQCANLMDRLQIDEELPDMFLEYIVRGAGMQAPDWYLRALWDEVQELREEYPDDPYPPDFEDTIKWLETRPAPDENQQRAGWSWISAQSWKHRLCVDESASRPWPVPCREIECGAYRIVPLRSLKDLREEGDAMHSCVATLGEDCAAGRLIVFSIRSAATGKRVATFSACWVPSGLFWQLLAISGKANCKVSEEVRKIAAKVASDLPPF